MFNDGAYSMGGMHGLWWIFWVVLIGLLLFCVWGRPGAGRRRPRDTPLALLQRRLAGGELSAEEYDKRKALLVRDGAGP